MDLSLFGIGLPQILLIMIVALLVFGPERLPEMARQAGRMVGQFRAWMQDARSELKTFTEVQEEFKTIKEDLANIRKDLSETSQEMLKELDDVRKEVDVRSDLAEALSDKPLEQYTYHVTENAPKIETASGLELGSAAVSAGIEAENDSKMVALIEDALNDANAAAIATNGHKPEEELTSEGQAATVRLEAAANSGLASDSNSLLQEQIAAILNNQEKFQKDFSVLVQHVSQLSERVSLMEQHPLLLKNEEVRKTADLI